MDLKSVFILLCFCLLQSRGGRSENIYQYNTTGEDVTLFCHTIKHYGPDCSTVDWRHDLRNVYVVSNGQIKNSSTSNRLTLNPDCSLSIKNITEGDHGSYFCGAWDSYAKKYNSYAYIFLSILSVSMAQPGLHQNPTGNTLQCTLWSDSSCGHNSFLWLDINRTVLPGDGVNQNDCKSSLTAELQSPQLRTVTCQYQVEGRVQVSAEFSLRGGTDGSESKPLSVYIISAAVVGGLVLLVVAAVLFFKIKSKKKTAETTEETKGGPHAADAMTDPENNMTYAVIDHGTPKATKQVKDEDAVTYSEVNLQNKSKSDHSTIYSQINYTAQG